MISRRWFMGLLGGAAAAPAIAAAPSTSQQAIEILGRQFPEEFSVHLPITQFRGDPYFYPSDFYDARIHTAGGC